MRRAMLVTNFQCGESQSGCESTHLWKFWTSSKINNPLFFIWLVFLLVLCYDKQSSCEWRKPCPKLTFYPFLAAVIPQLAHMSLRVYYIALSLSWCYGFVEYVLTLNQPTALNQLISERLRPHTPPQIFKASIKCVVTFFYMKIWFFNSTGFMSFKFLKFLGVWVKFWQRKELCKPAIDCYRDVSHWKKWWIINWSKQILTLPICLDWPLVCTHSPWPLAFFLDHQ